MLHMARHESGRIAPRFQRSRDAATKFAFQPRSLRSRGLHAKCPSWVHFVATQIQCAARRASSSFHALHLRSAFIKNTHAALSRCPTTNESRRIAPLLRSSRNPTKFAFQPRSHRSRGLHAKCPSWVHFVAVRMHEPIGE